jgi:hypothetical protein
MGKLVNIDEYLSEKEMEFVVKGKKYVVKDIPLDLEEKVKDGIKGIKEALASMFNCNLEELDGLGQGACIKIWEEVNKNFLPQANSPNDQSSA